MHLCVMDCKTAIETNAIRNCPINKRDIEIAEDVWGPALEPLKGKTTRKKPMVAQHDYVAAPKHVQEKHKDIVLTGDVFCAQGLPFFITLFQDILFATTECLKNWKLNALIDATNHALKSCNSKDPNIQAMNVDQESDKNDCRNALLERVAFI